MTDEPASSETIQKVYRIDVALLLGTCGGWYPDEAAQSFVINASHMAHEGAKTNQSEVICRSWSNAWVWCGIPQLSATKQILSCSIISDTHFLCLRLQLWFVDCKMEHGVYYAVCFCFLSTTLFWILFLLFIFLLSFVSIRHSVVYEHRSRLEKSLQKERVEHKKAKEGNPEWTKTWHKGMDPLPSYHIFIQIFLIWENVQKYINLLLKVSK